MLTIDGSQGEGGGQVLRTALALSALTGTPFRIENIRAGREKSGLRPQHVAAAKAVAQLCQGTVDGAEENSQTLTFYPRTIKGGTLELDIGTAGSVTLLLQSLLLPALFADKPSRITITGGTDVPFAMPVDYFAEVLVPQLRSWAEKLEVKVLRRGYVPAGQGKVEVFVKPKLKRSSYPSFDAFAQAIREQVRPFELTNQDTLVFIRGVSHASRDLEKDRVAERQADAAHAFGKADCRIRSEYSDSTSTGSGLTLWAVYSPHADDIRDSVRLGADALGQKGFPAENVGKTAAKRLQDAMNAGAPVDAYLADNLIPFLALAGGVIRAEKVTAHTRTNIEVVHQFLETTVRIENNTLTTMPRA
ncbi:MAG TPA: RNA 3'-terminal phosphate cyclase [Candidatus Binatia bacterium]|nr:RNA 3'-terminal phosphate cyclase [Candidatus Binatia bacterium]